MYFPYFLSIPLFIYLFIYSTSYTLMTDKLKLATGPALDLAFRTSNGDHGTVTSVKGPLG